MKNATSRNSVAEAFLSFPPLRRTLPVRRFSMLYTYDMRKFIIVGSIVIACIILAVIFFARPSMRDAHEGIAHVFDGSGSCNVATVAVDGYLDSEESTSTPLSSWDISQSIRQLDLSDKKALVVFLDSYGGLPEAAEEISSALREVTIPTVAYVRGDALSGGYWIAASTNHIIALQTALIGNIGVNSSYLDESKSNGELGINYEEITSGQYKDAGNPDKTPNAADLQFLQQTNTDIFNIFKSVVMTGRNMTTQQFAAVSDAKFYVASEAKD